ncbi:GNAT family N-acetyltransferase [Xenorhabdus miraniensis]|uniref:GNAT family acetyltransferase n=1 Tax=Xenorhabdus miraniensis TaxID=351674 RepID=A0A2D0JQM5_9GAMM|nr:GNAT family N-acetyltransferase [Xenorhabdus miraniensis]PHM48585.1 GNAT family acetyltransferase [Xenorhabdus miraniensis]PHM48918.1 GNAT family acetyltransferase [Xenorhabdus miraniensis]
MKTFPLSAAILAYHQIEDHFFSSISQMYQHISKEVRVYVTGVETSALNLLLVTGSSVKIAEELKTAIRLLDEHVSVPFMIAAIDPDSQILAVIQQAGFVPDPDSVTTAMQLDLMGWQMSDVSAMEYEIRRVDHCLDDWATPIENAFETEKPTSGQYRKCHQAALEAGKDLQHYVLYVEGQPVCALTLSRQGNIARFDDIGTVVEMQGRRYASVLINQVLHEAKQQDATECYLEASRDGNGLYRRVGFKPLFEYQGFIRE